MSNSSIQCRSCGRTLAKRHHSGNITFEVGIRIVMLKYGRVQAKCPCGDARAFLPEQPKKAA